MDFFIIANAWSAGKDNPTSKHRIALELVRQGHRVLWIEGSGMRTPSVGSSHDRLRMVRKVVAALRGVRREEGGVGSGFRVQAGGAIAGVQSGASSNTLDLTLLTPEPRTLPPSSLWILSPLFIPLPKYELIRRLNGLICRWSMTFWGWRLGFRDPVLINYVPVLAEAMRGFCRVSPRLPSCHVAKLSSEGENDPSAPPATTHQLSNLATTRCAPRIVYHCVDRWDAFAMYDSAMMGEMDRRCCRYADLVIASAGELYDRCRVLNPRTVLIPHGVDWEHFRSAINTPQSSSSSVIGFFGLLSEWVDQPLLLRLAKEFPDATLLLIGKADVPVSSLQGIPNIHLLGPKPFSELPAHIAGFTVGIIPFEVNDLTRSVNPIKLREMLSAGCPVVSTALPEVERYGAQRIEVHAQRCPAVQIARDHNEFVEAVRRILDNPLSPDERRMVSDSMAGETWTAKVNEILVLIRGGE